MWVYHGNGCPIKIQVLFIRFAVDQKAFRKTIISASSATSLHSPSPNKTDQFKSSNTAAASNLLLAMLLLAMLLLLDCCCF